MEHDGVERVAMLHVQTLQLRKLSRGDCSESYLEDLSIFPELVHEELDAYEATELSPLSEVEHEEQEVLLEDRTAETDIADVMDVSDGVDGGGGLHLIDEGELVGTHEEVVGGQGGAGEATDLGLLENEGREAVPSSADSKGKEKLLLLSRARAGGDDEVVRDLAVEASEGGQQVSGQVSLNEQPVGKRSEHLLGNSPRRGAEETEGVGSAPLGAGNRL